MQRLIRTRNAEKEAKNILVADRQTKGWKPLDLEADYSYASYYYARDPDLINTLPAQGISIVKDKEGRDLDAVEVVVRYLDGLPQRTTSPKTGRLRLIAPMPAASFGSPEIQPWRGAILPSTPAYTELSGSPVAIRKARSDRREQQCRSQPGFSHS